MAEPKSAIETAILTALTAAGLTAYNATAATVSLPYVTFTAAGGDDAQYHLKERGWIYRYDVMAVGTDRADTLTQAGLIDGALTGALAVSGYDVVDVHRREPVDYVQTVGETAVYFVGGTYEIEID